ncbi:hypothetical protein BXO88_05535 [Oribacterium sp. C9]|uniref:hypothetical protein n=1 Tax=Oribacterium sp. C9 TaxID=1943579 RepID=UPI00098F6377|nr:hypothetical protein [Oribacterium sp. C9]OON87002.1 hypothetical protein BXO88_05535 [Oribacterium sp. C9]
MRLVNCPICGTRCSADLEKCPECGFEIGQYFANKAIDNHTKKPPILIICAVFIMIMVFVAFSFFKTKSESLIPEAFVETSIDNTPTDTYSATRETTTVSTSVEETTITSNEDNIDICGVYAGDDHEILVLNSDGLAYYYCITIQYTELACPWYIKDDNIYIELSRLHCTIFSKVDEKELIFKSDSTNWNTELFTRLNVEPEQYLTKIPKTNDPMATMNMDGTINYTLDNITYILPKTFMDVKDEFDSMNDTSSFIDQDTQSDYIASITFYKTIGSKEMDDTFAKNLAETFASGFYKNITISDCSKLKIAGQHGFRFKINGFLNKGFNVFEGHEIDGFIIIFYNRLTGNNNYIMMVQTSNRALDDTSSFESIIKSAG